jgi:hypothetical protein
LSFVCARATPLSAGKASAVASAPLQSQLFILRPPVFFKMRDAIEPVGAEARYEPVMKRYKLG